MIDVSPEMDALKRLVSRSTQDMGLDGFLEFYGPYSQMTATEIWFRLELLESANIIVAGSWSENRDIDVYDAVLRYAEANFSRVRQEKFISGPLAGCFAVIMADPLSNSWRADENDGSIEQ